MPSKSPYRNQGTSLGYRRLRCQHRCLMRRLGRHCSDLAQFSTYFADPALSNQCLRGWQRVRWWPTTLVHTLNTHVSHERRVDDGCHTMRLTEATTGCQRPRH